MTGGATERLAMKLDREDLGDVTILKATGVLSGGPDGERLKSTVQGILDEGCRKVVMDLNGVAWANSAGLGVLHSCFTTVKNTGGSMKLTNVTPRVSEILKITHFDTVFESHPGVREALASFYHRTAFG